MTHYLWCYEMFQISKDFSLPGTGPAAERRYLRHAHLIWKYPRFTDAVRYRWNGWERW